MSTFSNYHPGWWYDYRGVPRPATEVLVVDFADGDPPVVIDFTDHPGELTMDELLALRAADPPAKVVYSPCARWKPPGEAGRCHEVVKDGTMSGNKKQGKVRCGRWAVRGESYCRGHLCRPSS